MKKAVLVNHKVLVAFVLFLLAVTLFAYFVSALQEISTVTLNSTFANNLSNEDLTVNTTLDPQNGSTDSKIITTNMAYKSGTLFDTDDDGVELNTSAIDFTVENTNFSWQVNEAYLCTQWRVHPDGSDTATAVCYGSSECCALLEVSPEISKWNDPLVIATGLYGTAANNTISSRVIYANYSFETDNIYSDIIYNEWASLTARFLELSNVTEDYLH